MVLTSAGNSPRHFISNACLALFVLFLNAPASQSLTDYAAEAANPILSWEEYCIGFSLFSETGSQPAISSLTAHTPGIILEVAHPRKPLLDPSTAIRCQIRDHENNLFTHYIPATRSGYRFFYPSDCHVRATDLPGIVILTGPQHPGDKNGSQASLLIVTLQPTRELNNYLEEKVSEIEDQPGVELKKIVLGGDTEAVVIEGWPEELDSRVVYAVHNGSIHILAFSPLKANADAQADMERIYQIVLDSWTFFD